MADGSEAWLGGARQGALRILWLTNTTAIARTRSSALIANRYHTWERSRSTHVGLEPALGLERGPADYESAAATLSYAGKGGSAILAEPAPRPTAALRWSQVERHMTNLLALPCATKTVRSAWWWRHPAGRQ